MTKLVLMNPITNAIYQLQEITLLTWRVLRSFFRPPIYWSEILRQMDTLGVGSLAIILLTGTFTGGVLALNSANTLQRFGFANQTGQLVATSLIRELGPVLTCLMLEDARGRLHCAGRAGLRGGHLREQGCGEKAEREQEAEIHEAEDTVDSGCEN